MRNPRAILLWLAGWAAWLALIAVVWWATARTVPLVNVRWVAGIENRERAEAEQQFSLVFAERQGSLTARYFLLDPSPDNLRSIVLSPLVEDTAFIDRGAFGLAGAPYGQTWLGDRFRLSTLPRLLAMALFGLLATVAFAIARIEPWQARAAGVFALSALGHFVTFQFTNDAFDRITRGQQIALFGAVPFRDFFDPGYLLTLYSSALVQRVFGPNLLGECLLDIAFMAAGTTLVFFIVSRESQSTLWGIVAAGLVVASQPRSYDYDKILFFPLGLYVCWKYAEAPGRRALGWIAVTTVAAALYRYDSGLYVGAAAVAGIVGRHWGEWRLVANRLATLGVFLAVLTAPVLAFLQATAGLGNAFAQVTAYAVREGARSEIFQPARLSIDWSRPLVEAVDFAGGPPASVYYRWLPGWLTPGNAAASLYWLAVALPVAAFFAAPLLGVARNRVSTAKLVSLIAMTELVAAFVLRTPLVAHVPGAVPLVVILGGYILGVWSDGGRAQVQQARGGHGRRWLVAGCGAFAVLVTAISIGELLGIPPARNLLVTQRLVEYAQVPPLQALLPKAPTAPLVNYLRECTNPTDRVLITWFAPEVYFFSGRGFAGGLPVVFNEHWSGSGYQQRSLDLLRQESVPVIVTSREGAIEPFDLLWNFIQAEYSMAGEISLGEELSGLRVWTRRDLPIDRESGILPLPCFAS